MSMGPPLLPAEAAAENIDESRAWDRPSGDPAEFVQPSVWLLDMQNYAELIILIRLHRSANKSWMQTDHTWSAISKTIQKISN